MEAHASIRWMIALFEELAGVSEREEAYVTDGSTAGWLATLEGLSAVQASWSPGPGRPAVLGQSAHLVYCLRWYLSKEVGQPFEPDWAASWQVEPVDEVAWRAHIGAVGSIVKRMADALRSPRDWPEPRLAAAMIQVTHAAYHLGALRQVAALARAADQGR
ncbi:MAG: hypothetical protein R6X16_07355 [Anaerolineae bacterium]